MLSIPQQRLLIFMIQKKITKESQKIYKSIVFYKSINYLTRNGLVNQKKYRDDLRKNTYTLTWKGEILALILAGLSGENPDKKDKVV